jgi:hypothetical protein
MRPCWASSAAAGSWLPLGHTCKALTRVGRPWRECWWCRRVNLLRAGKAKRHRGDLRPRASDAWPWSPALPCYAGDVPRLHGTSCVLYVGSFSEGAAREQRPRLTRACAPPSSSTPMARVSRPREHLGPAAEGPEEPANIAAFAIHCFPASRRAQNSHAGHLPMQARSTV